jgi:copper(I)-binding protein
VSAIRVALVAVAAAAVTAACAAGQDAQTANERPSVDGTQGIVGDVHLEDVSIHAPAGNAYQYGADAPLTLYIANNGATTDTLVNVTSAAFTGWTIQQGAATVSTGTPTASPSAPVSPGAATAFSQTNIGMGNETSPETLLLTGLAHGSAPLYPGSSIPITLSFAKAGQITLDVPVELSSTPNQATIPPLPTSTA